MACWLAAPLRRLQPWLARPGVRRGVCWLGWASLAVWLVFVALVLALRYVVLPKIADYREDIERTVSASVGLPIHIGSLQARWQGLNPDLILNGVVISDRSGHPAFSLSRVEAVMSWQTVLRARPILSLLAFDQPVLNVRREKNGRITVAGIDTEGDGDPAFAEWVLEQKHIRVRNATVVWEDRLRAAPQLILEDLQFGLDNSGRRHRFGLSAAPPGELAARIQLRGEVRGDIGEALDRLAGKLYVELDYADLAGWQPWVDYPIDLPRGHGAVRVWGDLDDGAGKVTADLALEDLRVRLGKQLPELDLTSLRGRLEGRYKTDDWALAGKKLELQTLDGLRVVPSDFQLSWRRDAKTFAVNGEASANFVDVGAFAHLASYVPLDPQTRNLLVRHQPQGRISEIKASWSLLGEKLERYSLKAGFRQLGLLADGYFPGAEGLSGSVDLTEKSGVLLIDSGASALSLPAIFPEPDIQLDALRTRASWSNNDGKTEVRLEKLEFAGPDAAGSVNGRYLYTGDGPGEIDLTGKVDRANGTAVWRYMPHAVNAEARNWIRRGIVAGRGSEGKLILKGKLRDFPFRDPATGIFLVTAKARDAKIDYADGWPAIDGIEADMQFGYGMKIVASRGKIFGAGLSNVTVEIPDFESHEERLLIRGMAHGATSEFLRFIDQSPVAESIDRFTEGMKAVGEGSLDLQLDIPLRHVRDTKLRGDYRFQNNQVQILPALPTLQQVNGRLQITENSLTAQDLTGRAFGGPFKVQIKSAGDKVGVQAAGTANVADVSRHFGWPLLNHLSGTTGWKADIAVRKRNAKILIDSDLVGITSPLPDPLNKTASTPLPLHIERTGIDALHDQFRISLGKIGQGLILNRAEGFDRGVLALGSGELRLPDTGLAVRVGGPRIDADAWRNFLGGSESGGDAAAGGANVLSVLTLKTPVLRLFGRDFSQVDASLRPRDNGWQIALNTREAVGDLLWKSGGEGWIEGNFRRLQVQPAAEAAESSTSAINSLPGMSLTVDDFMVGDKALGKLDLRARNEKGVWRLDTLSLQNPDGGLTGKALWINTGRHQTRLDFELQAKDAGKLLDRLGYVETVKRGSARLAGNVQWNGPLTAIHYPSLGGQMTVSVSKGQFHKLEPGVGKLLGLISLQSLPRRLTLDFHDIFSDGLAFDSIDGKLSIQNGTMRTLEPLRIAGPAAQVEIEGSTDLQKETEDLRVVVRPELGGLAAVGTAALFHPVVGAAALVANTVLQKPLNRLFSYRYHVTGTWADPQVAKAGETRPDGEARPAIIPEQEVTKP